MQSFLFAMESIGYAYIIMVHDPLSSKWNNRKSFMLEQVVLFWRRRVEVLYCIYEKLAVNGNGERTANHGKSTEICKS